MNSTNLTYKGLVNVTMAINNKIIKLSSHNAGTDDLKKSLCKYLIGYTDEIVTPEFLDIRVADDEDSEYETMLNSIISLTGKSFKYDSSLNNWVAVFTAPVSYSNILYQISSGDDRLFRLYLLSSTDTSNTELAYLPVTAETLSNITPGVQVSVEWIMQILNGGGTEE